MFGLGKHIVLCAEQQSPTPFDEEDAQRAATVKATIDRLGLSNTQAAAEAGGVCNGAASSWFRRVNTNAPYVRADAAKLWAWQQTAQHRPTPEQQQVFDEEDAQRAATVKATIDRLGLTIAQAANEAGNVCASAASNWFRCDDTHTPSVRAVAAKLWAWHQTAQHRPTPEQQQVFVFDEEADAQRAAAVKATIFRLGLNNTQAAKETGDLCSGAASSWFRRVNTHTPCVRAVAAKLWAWHQTAQHRPTPEQQQVVVFDEEADAQRAAAVKATIDRLGLSNTQAAAEAGGVCNWFRGVNTQTPSVRGVAAKLWAWQQTAQQRPSATAECPKCGKTAADFPTGLPGLRAHTNTCTGPKVQGKATVTSVHDSQASESNNSSQKLRVARKATQQVERHLPAAYTYLEYDDGQCGKN